jgi:hypothetical protein
MTRLKLGCEPWYYFYSCSTSKVLAFLSLKLAHKILPPRQDKKIKERRKVPRKEVKVLKCILSLNLKASSVFYSA